MSVLPQELLRRLAAKSQETSKQASKVPGPQFRELMKVVEIDDKPKEKGMFSLFEEEDDEETKLAEAPISPLFSLSAEQAAALALSSGADAVQSTARTRLSADLETLFERMASTMILMCSSKETETTLFLDNPHFASSVFFGSTITIREFSTAPKAFNVEISTSTAAIAVLEAGKQDFLAAFQNGKFNFSIHRLDTQIQRDRPLFHRKERDDPSDSQEQKGGQE